MEDMISGLLVLSALTNVMVLYVVVPLATLRAKVELIEVSVGALGERVNNIEAKL